VSSEIPKNLDYNLTASEVETVNRKLAVAGVQMVVYSAGSIGPDEAAARKVFAFAKSLNVEFLVASGVDAAILNKLGNEFAIQLEHSPVRLNARTDFSRVVRRCTARSSRKCCWSTAPIRRSSS